MKKFVLYLLVILTTLSTTQGATYKAASAVSVTHTAVTTSTNASAFTPVAGFKFRKQSAVLHAFAKLKKYFGPDTKGGYRTQGGWSIASFICGVVGLFVASIPLGIAAIILGVVAISKHSQYQGLAIAGLTLGILEALIVLVYLAAH
ncbi:MAG: DUF4190 domain-containing protein [Sphingobacteriales bacterium]|nr:MAG: DUF4190 domain-containing protein [Sphingobacteriales bacterium]